MENKGSCFAIALLFSFVGVSAQTDSVQTKVFRINPWEGVNGWRASVGYRNDLEVTASYIISSYPEKDPSWSAFAMFVHNVAGGVEYLKDANRHAVGPKISYDLNYAMVSAQIGVDVLFSEAGYQSRLLPKIGFSLFSFINFYYGYNHNFRPESKLHPARHMITVEINLYDI